MLVALQTRLVFHPAEPEPLFPTLKQFISPAKKGSWALWFSDWGGSPSWWSDELTYYFDFQNYADFKKWAIKADYTTQM